MLVAWLVAWTQPFTPLDETLHISERRGGQVEPP